MEISKSNRIGIILFLIPAVILLVLFFIIPVGYVIYLSTQKWDGMNPSVFYGVKNYVVIFGDPVFIRSIVNNVVWALSAGLIQVPLAMITALMLSQKMRGWKFLRTVYFFPQVISSVALATMWAAIYNASYGLLNGLLKIAGLGFLQKNWLGDLNTAFPAMLLYWIPYIGYYMVIILADVQSIPEDYYEAASLDGASKFKQVWYITIPMIRESVVTCMTLAMIFGIRQFDQVYMLTNGGPANRTSVMVLYLYKKMQEFSYGTSSAAATTLIMIGVCVILTLRKTMGRKAD
jgi:raffinose/stachyose/melibiose transport system permease protein